MNKTVEDNKLRLGAIHHRTVVHGPGPHSIIHFQGCPFRCPECINPELQAQEGGFEENPGEVAVALREERNEHGLAGVVLSGGEPLLQPSGAVALLALCRRELPADVGLIVFTGFDLDAFRRNADKTPILAHADLIIAGPYRPGLDTPVFPYTQAKAMHYLTDRYRPADFEGLPRFEIRYAPDHIALLGFPTLEDIQNLSPHYQCNSIRHGAGRSIKTT